MDAFEAEVWIEVKSYKAHPQDPYATRVKGFNTWNMGGGKSKEVLKQCRNSSLHKQFSHDRMARRYGVHSAKAAGGQIYLPIQVDGFKWWFQQFKVDVKNKQTRATIRTDKSPKLGSYRTEQHIRNHLTDRPKGSTKTVNLNLFEDSSLSDLNSYYQRSQAQNGSYLNGDVVGEASIKNLVVETMFNSGLLPGDEEIKNLITDSMPDPD